MNKLTITAPSERKFEPRLTAELRTMPVDSEVAVKVERKVAACLVAFGRYHGWKMRRKREGDQTLVWRVG